MHDIKPLVQAESVRPVPLYNGPVPPVQFQPLLEVHIERDGLSVVRRHKELLALEVVADDLGRATQTIFFKEFLPLRGMGVLEDLLIYKRRCERIPQRLSLVVLIQPGHYLADVPGRNRRELLVV